MHDNQLKRIQELFHRAENLSREEQSAMLDEACGTDESLRNKVERLLQLPTTEVDDFVQTLAFGVDDSQADSQIPAQIGHYKIIRRIGAGGMGVVYLAQQQKPIRRQVALKLIKRGMDTEQTIARFETERQALAMFNHPHVAKVFDAGCAEDGRPYFALEYVEGLPITKYCDEHKLTIPQRLKLFIKVCEAIQHAHQKGVIHRDIKPSNILVSEQRHEHIPKVIDFGLAKALDQRLSTQSVNTMQGQMIGTPEYMSPEPTGQSGEDIDTRTDIYALGVLLYELLVGSLPFDPTNLRRASLVEISRIIREDEPPKPSEQISATTINIAGLRNTDRRSLSKCVTGDLDWITMKSLEKDRTRRYTNASELAADIHRYLIHEPVSAGPPSFTYRLKKFAQRNRGGVIAGSVFALVFFVAAGLVLKFAVAEAAQRDLAEIATQRAQDSLALAEQHAQETQSALDQLEAVVEIQSSMISDIDAEMMGRKIFTSLSERTLEKLIQSGASQEHIDSVLASFEDLNATDIALNIVDKEILAGAVATIDNDFADQPLLEAALRQAIGNTYREIGLFPQSLPQLERALTIRRQLLGNEQSDTLDSMIDMGILLMSMGKYTEALPHCREALDTSRRVLGNDHPSTLNAMSSMSLLLVEMGQNAEALSYCHATLDTRRRVLGSQHPKTLSAISEMGTLLIRMGKYAEALPFCREALDARRQFLGNDHPDTLKSVNNMGELLNLMNKPDEALEYSREAMEGYRRVLGNDHPETASSISNMGWLLSSMGKIQEALPYVREAMETSKRALGAKHPDTLNAINNMGLLYKSLGDNDEALRYFQEALKGQRQVLGDDNYNTLISINNMGTLLQSMEKYEEASDYILEAIEGLRRVLGDDHPTTVGAIYNMGILLTSTNRHAEALPYIREVHETQRKTLGENHASTLGSMQSLGSVLRDLGQLEEAELLVSKCVDGHMQAYPEGHWRVGWSLVSHGKVLAKLNRFTEAESKLLEAHAILAEQLGIEHSLALKCVQYIVDLYMSWQEIMPDTADVAKLDKWQAMLTKQNKNKQTAHK